MLHKLPSKETIRSQNFGKDNRGGEFKGNSKFLRAVVQTQTQRFGEWMMVAREQRVWELGEKGKGIEM